MIRCISHLALLALEIVYATSTIRLNTAFTSSFQKRQHKLKLPPSSFTSCSSSSNTDDTTSNGIDTSWGPADDWESLAIQQQNQNTDDFLSFFEDPARDMARSIELEAQQHQQDLANTNQSSDEDDFVSEVVDTIHSAIWDHDGPALYDTNEKFDKYANSIDYSDELGKEISLLVRCNEVPDNMNVEEGRALPDLLDEHKYNIQQLVVEKLVTGDEQSTSQYEPTAFFSNAILKMFQYTSRFSKGLKKEGPLVLTKEAVAKWMARSLDEQIGTYDRRVGATVARYGTKGVMDQDQFMHLYMEAATSDMIEDVESWKKVESLKRIKLAQPNFMNVWRDLENHGFSPPIVIERQRMQEKIDAEFDMKEKKVRADTNNFMDECEILEWGDNEHSSPRPSSRNKSSHELVEMCTDNKTPKRLRDGDFSENLCLSMIFG